MRGIIFVSILLGCSLLTGCGQKYYKNINSGRNFNQDASYCQSVAIGSVPNQIVQNNVQPYTPSSGTMRDQYGNVYRYQENYNFMAAAQNSMAMSQNSFSQLSANINTQAARDAIYNQCISQFGWVEISKQEYDIMNNRRNAQVNLQQQPYQAQMAAPFDTRENIQQTYNARMTDAEEAQFLDKLSHMPQAEAQHLLAQSYRFGINHVPQNEIRAVYWYQKAAEQNHHGAQLELKAKASRL